MASLGLWGDDTANNARGGRSWGSEDQEEAVLPPTEQGPLLLWVAWAEFQGPCVFEQRLSADSAWI